MCHYRAAVQHIEPQLPRHSHDIVLNNHKYTDSIEGYSLPANTNINSAAVLALEFGRQMQIAAQRQPNKLNKSLGKPVKNCNWFRFSARPLLAICNKSVKVERERDRETGKYWIWLWVINYDAPNAPLGSLGCLRWLGIIYAQTEYIASTYLLYMHEGVTSWQPMVVHAAAAYLLTVERLRILHDFIQNPEYYLRRHLTLQLSALQLQIGVELRNSQRENWLESAAKCQRSGRKKAVK